MTHTDSQKVDIKTAFEALPEEMRGKFEEHTHSCQTHSPIRSGEYTCGECFNTFHILTSDTVMAMLEEMEIYYYLTRINRGPGVGWVYECYYFSPNDDYSEPSEVFTGTSPLHVLLKALGEIGEK